MAYVLFVGEGPTDVGKEEVLRIISLTLVKKHSVESECRGVIPILVLRSLAEALGKTDLSFEAKTAYLRRMHGKGFARKIMAAMADAQKGKALGVVVVMDRGGEKNKERLKEMNEGRESARQNGLNCPAALGLAIEELEAWLLADETAIASVRNTQLPGANPNPERIEDPKKLLLSLLGESGDEIEIQKLYETISERLDLGRLKKRCPQGFQPFYNEVISELGESCRQGWR